MLVGATANRKCDDTSEVGKLELQLCIEALEDTMSSTDFYRVTVKSTTKVNFILFLVVGVKMTPVFTVHRVYNIDN